MCIRESYKSTLSDDYVDSVWDSEKAGKKKRQVKNEKELDLSLIHIFVKHLSFKVSFNLRNIHSSSILM